LARIPMGSFRMSYIIPTTTSALDMLISLPYVASKDADYP